MDFEHALHIFNSLYQDINGYTLSSLGRAEMRIKDKTFTYGEISPEAFYSILKHLPKKPKGNFYDLGSGTGKAVLLAHMLFDFSKTVGIELLTPLHQAAENTLMRYKNEYKSQKSKGRIELLNEDFLDLDFQNADIIFMHSTCFTDEVWEKLAYKFKELKKGSYVIAVTRALRSSHLEYLKSKEYGMAWGRATVHYYQKV